MQVKFCGRIFEENCGQEVAQDWLFVPTNKVCGAILRAAQQGQAGRSFFNPTFWCSDIFRVELDWLKSEGIAISSAGLGRRKIASPTKISSRNEHQYLHNFSLDSVQYVCRSSHPGVASQVSEHVTTVPAVGSYLLLSLSCITNKKPLQDPYFIFPHLSLDPLKDSLRHVAYTRSAASGHV